MTEKLTIETHRTLHTFANRTSLPTIQNLQKSVILADTQLTDYKNENDKIRGKGTFEIITNK